MSDLDLDAIEARTATSPAPHRDDVRALVAEVRRLRAEIPDAGAKALEEYADAIRTNPSTPYLTADDIARDIPDWVETFLRP